MSQNQVENPFAAHYAATKAYIQTLAEGLHRELAPFGVHVVSVAPSPVNSGFANRANMQMGLAAIPDQVAQGTIRGLGKRLFLTVRPGFFSQFLEGLLLTSPRFLRVRIMRGFKKHHAC